MRESDRPLNICGAAAGTIENAFWDSNGRATQGPELSRPGPSGKREPANLSQPLQSRALDASAAVQLVRQPLVFVLPWDLAAVGGVSEVVRNLLRQTGRDTSFTPLLLVVEGRSTATRIENTAAGVVARTWLVAPWNPVRPIRHLLSVWVRWPASVWRMRGLMRKIAPAAVNVHYPRLWCITLMVALRLACPRARLVLSFHGADLDELERGSRITRFWWRILLKSADAVTCCSRSLRSRLVRASGMDQVNFRWVHNGIDTQCLTEELQRGTLPAEAAVGRYIACVGAFEHKKGHDVLVRAFAAIHHHRPELRLVIVGRAGPLRQALAALVVELGLQDAVILKSDQSHPDTLALIRNAELFVLSSRAEPFGIVVLEAAFLGVPVIATAVGGIPEVLTDGVSALLVAPDDVDALARAMLRLLADESLRTTLANNARTRAISEFTWSAAFSHYRSALVGPGPGPHRSGTMAS